MSIIIFGPPGAGKGTQSKMIEERRGYKHISTGDLIREGTKEDSELGEYLRATLGDGKLIDSETVAKLLSNEIERSDAEHFVFDGFPRAMDQIPLFEDICEEHGVDLEFLLNLVVHDDQIMHRLTERRINKETGEIYHLDLDPPPADLDPDLIIHRKDDMPEVVKIRLEEYKTKTLPVLEYYRDRDMVYSVNGMAADETVYSIIEFAFATNDVRRMIERDRHDR